MTENTYPACPDCRDGKHRNCTGWALAADDQEWLCPCLDLFHLDRGAREQSVKARQAEDAQKLADSGTSRGIRHNCTGWACEHRSHQFNWKAGDAFSVESRVTRLEAELAPCEGTFCEHPSHVGEENNAYLPTHSQKEDIARLLRICEAQAGQIKDLWDEVDELKDDLTTVKKWIEGQDD